MRIFVLSTTVLLFSFAGVASADLVYDLVDYPAIQSDHTLSGTITTNGTIGSISVSDIVSWSYSVTGPNNWSSASTDSGASTKDFGQTPTVTASATEITISAGFFALSGGALSVPQYRYSFGKSLGINPSEDILWNTFYPTSTTVFATVSAVPEPSAFLFFGLAGVVALGVNQFRARRRKMEAIS